MKSVFQIWIGSEIPDREREWVESIRRAAVASGWTHRLWSWRDILDAYGGEPATRLLARCMEVLPARTVYGLLSDYFRLRILADGGGLYLDTDFSCPGGALPELPESGDLWGMVSYRGTSYANGAFWCRTPQAARALADAAAEMLAAALPFDAPDFGARVIELCRKDSTTFGIADKGCGPLWLCTQGHKVLRAGGWAFGLLRPPTIAHSCNGESGALVHHAGGAWREYGARLWDARATDAARADYLAALPPAARPQSSRSLPPAPRHRAAAPAALPDGLVLPRGVRRVVVFSNVTPAPPFELLPGDLCLHLNRARNFPAVRGTQGVTHSLLVRCWEENGARRWFEPESTDGFWQVLHIMDSPMCARRAWWQKYKADTHKSPTSGFIAWQLAREAAPELPVVLVGFAPGENFGTPLWRGHAWSYEAAAYARESAQIVRPEKQRTDHD